MKLPRFYCCPINNESLELCDREAHHLARVMRLGLNDKVELFDGRGALATAIISSVIGRKVALHVQQLQMLPRAKRPRIVIAAAVSKGDRLDWLIGKCTELDVDHICPVLFDRTVKQPKNINIVQRWQNISIAAAKQSRRLFLPRIEPPAKITDLLNSLKQDYTTCQILLGSLSPQAENLFQLFPLHTDVIAFIGPEGGLTNQEESLLRQYDAKNVRLTDTILRSETAAMAFAAILTAQRNAMI